MSGKVYLVLGGDHDTFGTVAVFSTSQKQGAFFETYRQADPNAMCEEFDLDPEYPELTPITTMGMNADGSVEWLKLGWQLEGFGDMCPLGFDGFGGWGGPVPKQMFYRVATSDREQAIAEANDARSRILAADAWGDHTKTRQVLGE